jgi:catalase
VGDTPSLRAGYSTEFLEERLMSSTLINDLLEVLDSLSGGVHPGFRPVHAKGTMYAGSFVPAPGAADLTRAPHAARPSTPVTVRFSVSSGIPTVPDNDPNGSSPQAMAVRFHLADHVHTDIIAHSHNRFPVRTGEELLAFFRAIAASGPGAPAP